jgi:signal transduction histidine kinase
MIIAPISPGWSFAPTTSATRASALAMADLGEMSALLDDTLTFARVSATPPRPVHETTDIAAMIGSVLEARALQGEDVTATSPPPTGLAVRIDPLAMQRILANLVDNAVRYGGQARLSVRERQGRIEIRVDDDGPGVPEADLKDLTRPFHRLDHSRAPPAGQLGLAIVDALAQQNGGTLTLGNRDGGGFSASVDLPAA